MKGWLEATRAAGGPCEIVVQYVAATQCVHRVHTYTLHGPRRSPSPPSHVLHDNIGVIIDTLSDVVPSDRCQLSCAFRIYVAPLRQDSVPFSSPPSSSAFLPLLACRFSSGFLSCLTPQAVGFPVLRLHSPWVWWFFYDQSAASKGDAFFS